jgi:hypothetical protein
LFLLLFGSLRLHSYKKEQASSIVVVAFTVWLAALARILKEQQPASYLFLLLFGSLRSHSYKKNSTSRIVLFSFTVWLAALAIILKKEQHSASYLVSFDLHRSLRSQ